VHLILVSLNTLYFHQSHFYLGRIPCINPAPIDIGPSILFVTPRFFFNKESHSRRNIGRRNVCRRVVVIPTQWYCIAVIDLVESG